MSERPERRRELRAAAAARGITLHATEHLEPHEGADRRALVVEGPAGLAALAALSPVPSEPTVLLSDGVGLDRVQAVRAGVTRFLDDTTSADEVLDAIEEAERPATEVRVLVCDDDALIVGAIESILTRDGFAVDTVTDPRRFFEVLEGTRPHLVLLDVDMPHVDGLTLCRTLRRSETWAGVPVMFVTSHADRGSAQLAFDVGADDVVAKPVIEAELRARVRNRLDRVRFLQRVADLDPLTGLTWRRAAEAPLRRMLSQSAAARQPVAVALLDVDGLDEINRRHGHARGDRVLATIGRHLLRHRRPGDLAARWGGDELLVAYEGVGARDAVHLVAEVLDELAEEATDGVAAPSFSAGVVHFPRDGADPHALYVAAREPLEVAKRGGGGRVVVASLAGPQDRLAANVDVVVVEDDAALSGLLQHALEVRGYRVEVVTDGATARERLAGSEADLRPRLVLLDVDLPAVNGLDVLDELGRAGVLERAAVLMLTARAAEAEVLQALRLGAADHVAKPFSLPVLLERVRRLLDR